MGNYKNGEGAFVVENGDELWFTVTTLVETGHVVTISKPRTLC